MKIYQGKSILKGITIGKILYYSKEEQMVQRRSITDTEAEWKRYEEAKGQASDQLNALYEKALKEVGETGAAIFEVHGMMLEDDDFNDSIKNMIEAQKVNAEYAVASTGDNFSLMFSQMDDEYFQARSADIKDIAERVVRTFREKESRKWRSWRCAGDPGGKGSGAQRDCSDGQIQTAWICDRAWFF